eukprot:259020_1
MAQQQQQRYPLTLSMVEPDNDSKVEPDCTTPELPTYHRSSLPPQFPTQNSMKQKINDNSTHRSSLPQMLGHISSATEVNIQSLPHFSFNASKSHQPIHYQSLQNINEMNQTNGIIQYTATPQQPQIEHWIQQTPQQQTMSAQHLHSMNNQENKPNIPDTPTMNKSKSAQTPRQTPRRHYPSQASIEMNPYIDQNFIFQPQPQPQQQQQQQHQHYVATSSSPIFQSVQPPQMSQFQSVSRSQSQSRRNSPNLSSNSQSPQLNAATNHKMIPPAIMTSNFPQNHQQNVVQQQPAQSYTVKSRRKSKLNKVKFAPRRNLQKRMSNQNINNSRRPSSSKIALNHRNNQKHPVQPPQFSKYSQSAASLHRKNSVNNNKNNKIKRVPHPQHPSQHPHPPHSQQSHPQQHPPPQPQPQPHQQQNSGLSTLDGFTLTQHMYD